MEKLLDAISEYVEEARSWREKKQDLLTKCNDNDTAAENLAEFLSWFDASAEEE